MNLLEKIHLRTAKIGIIGGGYVGLPLAVEFAKAGFPVIVFDLDEKKINSITQGVSYIPDVPTLQPFVENGILSASTTFDALDEVDAAIICVPTPLKKTKDPDIQYILAACDSIADHIHEGMFISLESSTYPGTTDELMLPIFESRGFTVGVDFYLCFSPERVDPGNPVYQTHNIPKVIGGITPECTKLGTALYSTVVESVVPVEGTRTAEMVKLLENTFRMVNIGLVNELAVMCDKMFINIWDVIDAAKTKPFGFMPFYPGPGLGGHCIPIDPFYFSWKAKQYGCEPRFIETAGYVNAGMPHYVVQKIQDALNNGKKSLNGSHIHLMGMAYKRDINDVRESPAIDVAILLIEKGAQITYYDEYIPNVYIEGKSYQSNPESNEAFVEKIADCVVILTDHSNVNYEDVVKRSQLVVDTRNATKGLTDSKIVRL